MSTKNKLIIVALAVLGLALSASWGSLAAEAPLSPRDNPEFWDRLSGVVVFDPNILNRQDLGLDNFPLDRERLFFLPLSVPTGPNVLCNQDPGPQHQNEPSIVVNPLDPLHVIASSNDYRLGAVGGDVHPGYYASFDGGLTWPGDGVIDLSSIPNAEAGGDPALAIHDLNNLYFAYIAFHRTIDDAGGVFVSKSTDGGLTWNDPITVALNTTTVFHDKEYIAVDATGSPYDGNVYVSWTRFEFSSPIYFSRSTDGGASFSPPMEISDVGLSSNQGSVPGVGPNGEVYVVWRNYNSPVHRMAVSPDGGASFGTSFPVANVVSIPSPLPGGSFRVNSFPTLGIDQNNGNLYVAWNDYRNGDADILFVRSTDGGGNWSAPIRVNDDPMGNAQHQFFPWMSVAPNGYIYVGWFDSRNDPGPGVQPFIYDEYVAVSTDGGLTFSPNMRISEVSSDASVGFSGQFIGDYSGIAATNDFVYPAWVDTRRTHQDIFTQANLHLESSKSAPALVERNQPFTYTIVLSSTNTITDNLLVDPLPLEVVYVPGSVWASAGNASEAGGVVSWDGDISAGLPVTITFQVTPTAFCSLPITNTATFTPGMGAPDLLVANNLISGTIPVASFVPSDWTPQVGEVVTFTNQSSGDPSLTFLWDFGQGVTSTQTSPTHIFEFPGSYTVVLTSTDTCGYDTHTETLSVTCDAPAPFFTWASGELAITFTNQTTATFTPNFLWQFGDGMTSTQTSPAHTYATPGPYTVTLTAADLCGSASYATVVNAACSPPEAAFTWAMDGLVVTFTNLSTGTFPLDFEWDFGDGMTATQTSPSYTYAQPGIYTVTLTVTETCGTALYEMTIQVGHFTYLPITSKP